MSNMKRKRLFTVLAVLLTATGLWAQDMPEEPKQINLTRNERQMARQNNGFGFDLFRQARKNENQVMSPLSITYLLGMLNNGAAGLTRDEICQVLGFGNFTTDEVNAFCRKMLTESIALDELTKVNIGNAIFLNQPYGICADFEQAARDYYFAEVSTLDFHNDPAMDIINQWASDQTNGLIPEILNVNSFNPDAVSYLLNAIYFKGAWTLKFDKEETIDEPFDGGLDVPMMHLHNLLPYTENDVYQMVALPYGNQAYQMNILLPREGKTIDDVLANINGESWENSLWLSPADVDVKMPRIETETDLPLVDIMKSLGMEKAFDKYLAEFPGFYTNIDGNTYIGMMKQVAKIKLDEEGTEAAAVTVVEVACESIEDPEEPKTYELHADRPFVYVISERSTGAIFFIGQYVGPGEGSKPSPGEDVMGVEDIQALKIQSLKNQVYDLQGRLVSSRSGERGARSENADLSPLTSCPLPLKKGIYITNGRKIIVR